MAMIIRHEGCLALAHLALCAAATLALPSALIVLRLEVGLASVGSTRLRVSLALQSEQQKDPPG
jgi:hypothetical protein